MCIEYRLGMAFVKNNHPLRSDPRIEIMDSRYRSSSGKHISVSVTCAVTTAPVSHRNMRRWPDPSMSANTQPININTNGKAQIHGSLRTPVVSSVSSSAATINGVVFPKYLERRW